MLIGPFLIGIVAAGIVRWLRVRQLRRWDLAKTLAAPSVSPYLWAIGILTVMAGLSLTLATVAAEACAPEQKWANVIYLVIGLTLSTALCVSSLVRSSRLYREGRA